MDVTVKPGAKKKKNIDIVRTAAWPEGERLSKSRTCCIAAGWLIPFLWRSGALSGISDTCHSQDEQKFDSQRDDVP